MKRIISLLFIITILASCSFEVDKAVNLNCEKNVIIDNSRFKSMETAYYEVTEASITGDCLELSIRAQGCSGDAWVVELIDAAWIKESLPVQRDLKISLENGEDCAAMVSRSFSFNLQPLQTEDEEIILNLENWEEPLLYSY